MTLKVVFLRFIWWERGKVRVRVGLRRFTSHSYRVRIRVRVSVGVHCPEL